MYIKKMKKTIRMTKKYISEPVIDRNFINHILRDFLNL